MRDSEFAREKAWARIHLIPLLEAESDRDAVRRQLAAAAHEKELMKDVKGWKFGSVYNSDRCVLRFWHRDVALVWLRRCAIPQIHTPELHAGADRMRVSEVTTNLAERENTSRPILYHTSFRMQHDNKATSRAR